ncbi:MAG: hypothetical protein K2X29_06505, partial [Candidatus Obscuribacterales bacterium]|nr:hypothetical protein [Candidatus Obscuribacterales bacterium]
MSESTLNKTTASATYALKTTHPLAWDSLAHAHAEASKAGSVLITPTDILVGILLNTGAVNAHHALWQLGVERIDETMDKLRSNRPVPSNMKDIRLSSLFGSYRRLVESTVSEAKDVLLQELARLQDEIIPQVEQLANEAVKSLTQCGMDEDQAIDAVRELRESTNEEMSAINCYFEKAINGIDERSRSITGPSSILSTWILNARKGIYPYIKADDVDNIFSKDSQLLFCLARQSNNRAL